MRGVIGLLIGFFAVFFAANLVTFKVMEYTQVVVTQFGEPINTITEPGLYWKLPDPIQRVHIFDKRMLDYDADPNNIYTKDKKTLVLDNYARWRIVDPLLFMQALRTEREALARLDDIVYSELRKELGQHDLVDVVRTNRAAIMQLVTERSDEAAREFGISVVDVRVKRADLHPENETAVFNRMRAERAREAKTYRSEGEEEALKIMAETDLEAASIAAQAYETAQRTRGEGDAEALTIYASAYKNAENFFEFTRTLEAYEKALDENTVLVQPLDTDFFKYLQGRQ